MTDSSKPSFLTVWVAHGDGGEHGKGPVIGYSSTKERAALIAKGRGWYGRDGDLEPVPAIRIGDKVWLLLQASPIDLDSEDQKRDAELRASTIAGLSAEQRRVLGL